MATLELIISIVTGVAGLLTLWFSATGWRKKGLAFVGMTLIGAVVFYAASAQKELSHIRSIERTATKMLEDKRSRYTEAGFIQGVLAFLEKNKDEFPDTYQRALLICEKKRMF